jgi:hypothetical protein
MTWNLPLTQAGLNLSPLKRERQSVTVIKSDWSAIQKVLTTMFNLHLYEGKTVRSFDQRGDQLTVYFTDESFLIITGISGKFGKGPVQLDFQGKALDNETH